jgi:uncharacterized protein (UPF0332 family)
MSVTPDDFLESARSLAAENDEMARRNALSRAYYAAFHRIVATIRPVENDDTSKSGMHRRFINQLMSCDSGTSERLLGVKLQTLYSRRITADYRLGDDILPAKVAQQISCAREIFNIV